MYVCLCHGVTEDDIRFAAEEGLCSLQDLKQCLGVSTGCGQCAQHAIAVLEETRLGKMTFTLDRAPSPYLQREPLLQIPL